MTGKRADLLSNLEWIVGNECYNSKIQNWGPNGMFIGEGRDFRYPLTVTVDGAETKVRGSLSGFSAEAQMSGRYKFGTNELLIMRALDQVVIYLERHHG